MWDKREYLYKRINRLTGEAGMELIKYRNGRSDLPATHNLWRLLMSVRSNERDKIERIERETGYDFLAFARKIEGFLESRSPGGVTDILQEMAMVHGVLEQFGWQLEKQIGAASADILRNV